MALHMGNSAIARLPVRILAAAITGTARKVDNVALSPRLSADLSQRCAVRPESATAVRMNARTAKPAAPSKAADWPWPAAMLTSYGQA